MTRSRVTSCWRKEEICNTYASDQRMGFAVAWKNFADSFMNQRPSHPEGSQRIIRIGGDWLWSPRPFAKGTLPVLVLTCSWWIANLVQEEHIILQEQISYENFVFLKDAAQSLMRPMAKHWKTQWMLVVGIWSIIIWGWTTQSNTILLPEWISPIWVRVIVIEGHDRRQSRHLPWGIRMEMTEGVLCRNLIITHPKTHHGTKNDQISQAPQTTAKSLARRICQILG